MLDADTPFDDDTAEVPGGERRGWLYGTAVVLVAVLGLIAFAASRGGDRMTDTDMPGMDMDGMDGMDMGGG